MSAQRLTGKPVRDDLTVLVTCHNYGQWVEACVESIIAGTQHPAELLIVNDGSTDDSKAIIDALAAKHAASINIRAVHQENMGIARTLNTAFASVGTLFVACVCADDTVRPTYVETLTSALAAEHGAAVAYGEMQMFGLKTKIMPVHPTFDPGRLLWYRNDVAGASVFRRHAVLNVGGFPTDVRYEDGALTLALFNAGWTGVPVAEVLYDWRQHTESRSYRRPALERVLSRWYMVRRNPRLARQTLGSAPRWLTLQVLVRVAQRLGGPDPWYRDR